MLFIERAETIKNADITPEIPTGLLMNIIGNNNNNDTSKLRDGPKLIIY